MTILHAFVAFAVVRPGGLRHSIPNPTIPSRGLRNSAIGLLGCGLGLLLLATTGMAAPVQISTFAGNLIPEGDATNVGVGASVAAVNASGDVIYITDTGNNRVRKISASGTITTIVGTGAAGFAGDNGLATVSERRTDNHRSAMGAGG